MQLEAFPQHRQQTCRFRNSRYIVFYVDAMQGEFDRWHRNWLLYQMQPTTPPPAALAASSDCARTAFCCIVHCIALQGAFAAAAALTMQLIISSTRTARRV
jgi:hypothetical protein